MFVKLGRFMSQSCNNGSGACFAKVPVTFRAGNCFVFVVFAFKIKV